MYLYCIYIDWMTFRIYTWGQSDEGHWVFQQSSELTIGQELSWTEIHFICSINWICARPKTRAEKSRDYCDVIVFEKVVTRMDTLKSGWTHYVGYTIHLFFSVFCLMTPIMYLSGDDNLTWNTLNKRCCVMSIMCPPWF